MPLTLTLCEPIDSWQFGAQPPTLLASETNAIVAAPLLAPALLVSMPTTSAVLGAAPGARPLKLPLAVIGAAALIDAFNAACGASVATLVTLIDWVGDAAPTRTLPRLTAAVFTCGEAWLMMLPVAWIVPVTPNGDEPTASSPRPLLTPSTAPALK